MFEPPTKADVALYRQLAQRTVRQQEGLWLVEGPNAVEAAIKAGLTPKALFTLQGSGALIADAGELQAWQGQACVVDAATMGRMASTSSPPPALGVFYASVPSANPLPQAGQQWLGLAGLQDPGNVGTLIRCLRAFGGAGLLTTDGTVDCYSPKVIRASAGEVFFCPIWQNVTLAEVWPPTLPIWATQARQATPFTQVDWSTGGLLLLGQEGGGLDEAVLPPDSDPHWVSVPQAPTVDSLNVAVSGAIVMAQWYKSP
jgi:RNA methyltransferase, TrmH family